MKKTKLLIGLSVWLLSFTAFWLFKPRSNLESAFSDLTNHIMDVHVVVGVLLIILIGKEDQADHPK